MGKSCALDVHKDSILACIFSEQDEKIYFRANNYLRRRTRKRIAVLSRNALLQNFCSAKGLLWCKRRIYLETIRRNADVYSR